MRRQVNKYEGKLNNWYACKTCMQLLKKHRTYFDDGYGICWMNCVDDG